MGIFFHDVNQSCEVPLWDFGSWPSLPRNKTMLYLQIPSLFWIPHSVEIIFSYLYLHHKYLNLITSQTQAIAAHYSACSHKPNHGSSGIILMNYRRSVPELEIISEQGRGQLWQISTSTPCSQLFVFLTLTHPKGGSQFPLCGELKDS